MGSPSESPRQLRSQCAACAAHLQILYDAAHQPGHHARRCFMECCRGCRPPLLLLSNATSRLDKIGATSPPCGADGRYEVWLVLDTNTLMQLPEELLAFHAASKDSILPRSGAFRSIDLDIKYYVPQAVIRELDYRKSEGNADGECIVGPFFYTQKA